MKLDSERFGKAVTILFCIAFLLPVPADATEPVVVGELITSTS